MSCGFKRHIRWFNNNLHSIPNVTFHIWNTTNYILLWNFYFILFIWRLLWKLRELSETRQMCMIYFRLSDLEITGEGEGISLRFIYSNSCRWFNRVYSWSHQNYFCIFLLVPSHCLKLNVHSDLFSGFSRSWILLTLDTLSSSETTLSSHK